MLLAAPTKTESIPDFCEALSCNKCIHTKSQLYENRSKGINIHIGDCVRNGILTGSKSHKKASVSGKKDQSQQKRYKKSGW